MKFCESTIVKTKTILTFPNNKPWVTKDLKMHLNRKKHAFIKGDMSEYKEKAKDFNRQARIAKLKYKNKVEQKFKTGNVREAWDGLKTMMGKPSKQSKQHIPQSAEEVNNLNQFYARFDVRDLSHECETLCQSLEPESLELTEAEVVSVFKHLKPNKAPGPDGVKGRVLKSCASQLGQVFTYIFQFLLNMHVMPRAWKTSTIIPIPKRPNVTQPNDFRPVALTSVLAKCFESVLCKHLRKSVCEKLDPHQFAYKARRGVEDASLTLLNLVAKHLDKPRTHVRILMIDFSSAFNSMEPLVLLQRLIDLGVNSSLVLFINDFLRDRPQRVRSGGTLSDEIIVSTGAPQGCVLSPTLFSIYTDEIRFSDAIIALFKFADDMALVGLLTGEESLAAYYAAVKVLELWCKVSFLELNVKKTKELVFDERRGDIDFVPVSINGEDVEVVSSFKYLGTVIDNRLRFDENADQIFKKSQQRMYLLRKLKSFGVNSELLQTVYRSLIESVLSFNIACWYGNLGVRGKTKLGRIVRLAGRIIGAQQIPLGVLYENAVKRKTAGILSDTLHPLASEFQVLPSRRRYKMPLAKKNMHKRSFIPSAIAILNGRDI
jgi:hypothetical protein